MKKNLILLLLLVPFLNVNAQRISIKKGWKLMIGDNPEWSAPGFNDSGWQTADLNRPWEQQGHQNYDGFGWYRTHVVIPSSLKEKAFLKDSLLLNLASVDDNDEVFLNGTLIGKYGGHRGNIKEGHYGPRSYKIASNNPALLWDKDNVIAVRIYDTGGDGGIYGEKFEIHMADIMEGVEYNTSADFSYGDKNMLGKTIKLETKNVYKYAGTLSLKVTDPETGAVILSKTTDNANFTKGSPFSWWFTFNTSQKKSYNIIYTFHDKKTGTEISETETTPYILTPAVGLAPRINGASTFGVRPGHEVLFLIPATGLTPLTYKVAGLPAGLKVDKSKGIITGVVNKAGNYPLTFTVTNRKGTATKKFVLAIGDKIGLTPALGWNSWNAWGLSVNDEKVRTAAREMSERLASHGWSYINIDDGWEADSRDANGKIVTNNKFPDMKGLTDYVHSLGLRMGIYSSPGPRTCGGYLGSYQHDDDDAITYGDWGIDYLKYDWCSYGEIAPNHPDLDDMKKPYLVMRKSLDKASRDILFSYCQYGMGDVWKWGAEAGGNSWRTTGDITDTWSSMSGIGFNQDKAAPYAGPGHFNDPDMLVVGKVGWGPTIHNTRLTFDEQYTHISLWSLLASPLLIGCDMGHVDRFTLNLLTNDEVIAISQDALGKEARQYVKKDDYQIWVKQLSNGRKAIGLFNTSDKYQTISLPKSDAALKGFTKYRDAWRQQNLTAVSGKVAPHGVLLVTVSK
ncbi:putative Ig domain-containing protein [Mucilaginibacter sp. dw_454]|uniref:putative Ig domain-containing protein n=1 Tax=Mucilaginibacter sp. dw_454 TaxID=2720079 RepID=UPI001BD36664|nr:putative Ig domain-containing protein [Mucilaginibacter sp. dw_454]